MYISKQDTRLFFNENNFNKETRLNFAQNLRIHLRTIWGSVAMEHADHKLLNEGIRTA